MYQEWTTNRLYSFESPATFKFQYLAPTNENIFIPMPPPNITGRLHLGHSLFLTLQDSLIRFNKTKGNKALWIPGLDHAGLATFEKIQLCMKEKNCDYDTAATELPESNKETILSQIKQMGALPDWDYLTYTLDPEYESLTKRMIKLLLKEKRIYFKEGNYFLKLQDYAAQLLEAINHNEFKIIPSYEAKNLTPFLENLEDWNISRQIPWGTKIPLKLMGNEIIFDEAGSLDCLDTWFNSSLWIQASLQKNPKLLEEFYPATCIETGADILFFWCARMLIMGSFMFDFQEELNLKLKTRYGFKTIYLHGLIRDKLGRKFSKSLGNGIDPLAMIEKYGADALRLCLLTRSGPSEDIKFDENQLHEFKKFINKIYQAGRFFSMYANKCELEKLTSQALPKENLRLKEIQEKFNNRMSSYQFLEAGREINSDFKTWFCSEWIEANKDKIQELDKETITEGILILNQMLAMLEPFCPYITYWIHKQLFE